MIKILIISCSLQPQYTIILFNTLRGGKKRKKSRSEQAPAGMWARKGYYSITSESTINKSSLRWVGRSVQCSTQNCTALQDSDSSTSPLLIIIPTRLSLQQGREAREGNHLWAWLESMVWLSELRAGTHRSGFCLLWSFSDGQCGWCPKDNACGQALQGWAPQYKRDMEIVEWVQQRAIKDGSIWHRRRGWESWDSSAFKKRRVRENLIYVYQYLTGECKEDRLFSVVATQRAMGTKWHTRNAILTWRTYLLWEWSPLEQVAQRLSFLGDIWPLSGCGTQEPLSSWPCLSWGLGDPPSDSDFMFHPISLAVQDSSYHLHMELKADMSSNTW